MMRVAFPSHSVFGNVTNGVNHYLCYYYYILCELGEQAWLNEFQGDSFRLLFTASLERKCYANLGL
jgi:hypothetical protein